MTCSLEPRSSSRFPVVVPDAAVSSISACNGRADFGAKEMLALIPRTLSRRNTRAALMHPP